MADFFDPNKACEANGRYFGFPYSEEEADLILVSVPWDVTTSYRAGTASGPEAILNASLQLDFFDYFIDKAWENKIGTLDINKWASIKLSSSQLRPIAEKIINNAYEDDLDLESDLHLINEASEELNNWVYDTCKALLNENKKVGIIGGEHSVALGYIKALSEKYTDFGILHIDAHADLRNAYEGFEFSHASIMYNALKIKTVEKLVQIGIRDTCEEEFRLTQEDTRIKQFPDCILQKRLFEGDLWMTICDDIIKELPKNVYISFDIDGLDPSLCPNTGTAVPGGLSFTQAVYLINRLKERDINIIGFDLCEVAPDRNNMENEFDGNVGARILYMLCCNSYL